MKALSVRQPWAWLIVNGHKDIENRSWSTQVQGKVWIHAGLHRVTKAEYENFVETCRDRRIRDYPKRDDFKTGGIIGSVEIVRCVTASRSYWFEKGKVGFVLRNASTTRFRRMLGKLHFFDA